MRDLIIDALRIVAPLSVALIVFAEALGIAPSQVVTYFKDRPAVMLRSFVAALILVPAAALGLILVARARPGGRSRAGDSRGLPPSAVDDQIGDQGGRRRCGVHREPAPLPWRARRRHGSGRLDVLAVPLGFSAEVDPFSLLKTLANTILLPVGLGLVVRACSPRGPTRSARSWAKSAAWASSSS